MSKIQNKERKMKKIVVFMLVLLTAVGFVFAAAAEESAQDEVSNYEKAQQWAKENGLDKDESMEELYQAALKEGGKVVIYTASSRHAKVKADFEATYPGMELICYNLKTGEIIEKLNTENEAGIINADIVQSKEVSGEYTKSFLETGILLNYQPDSIWGNTDPSLKKDVTPFFIELTAWFYNDSVYKDGSPVDSWWDLLRPEFDGQIIFQDPASSPTYMAFITALTSSEGAEMMAKSYKEEFGTDIVLANDEPNAGYAWINRYLKSNNQISSIADETVKAVGTAEGVKLIGYSASSKIREKEGTMPYLATDMVNFGPALSLPAINFVSIVNGCEHPNGAKLYLKYVMGGEDGKGKGYKPFNTLGAFPVRPEIDPPEGSDALTDIALFPSDYDYYEEHHAEVYDYWLERI